MSTKSGCCALKYGVRKMTLAMTSEEAACSNYVVQSLLHAVSVAQSEV